jgi:hypothetical protein
MQILRVTVLAVLSSVCVTSALAQSETAAPQPTNNVDRAAQAVVLERLKHLREERAGHPATVSVGNTKPTCYALRSYQFARPEAGSDRTTPVGYTTCQSTAQFTVKQADLRK